MSGPDPRSRIPGVDRLLASEDFRPLRERFGRERLIRGLRGVLDEARTSLAPGGALVRGGDPGDTGAWARRTRERLLEEERPSLRRVINATGVVLHTNLGRAPLAPEALEALVAAGGGYASLEIDLDSGARGSRYRHCVEHLRTLTGGDDALVVNNAAAALVLAVAALARGREVVVSRGELVEIGGGFRIPEVLSAAGARLREVGTTNRTRTSDYREAVESGEAGMILKVHRSNFRITGFTEEAPLDELAGVGRAADLPLVHDLGSGLLHPAERLGLPPEPRPDQSLAGGADLVVFSGDKLLGGPQAGIIVGRGERVAALRRHPLCRALRVDKGTLAALEATLRLHLDPERALCRIPTLRSIREPVGSVRERADGLREKLEARGIGTSTAEGVSVVGGGTFPGVELPTAVLRIDPEAAGADGVGAEEIAHRLRSGEPPVVPRVEDGWVVLDLRTVDEGEVEILAGCVQRALEEGHADAPQGRADVPGGREAGSEEPVP